MSGNPQNIVMKHALVGHRAAVNVVDFDEKYIVSASGDRTIKVILLIYYYYKTYVQLVGLTPYS